MCFWTIWTSYIFPVTSGSQSNDAKKDDITASTPVFKSDDVKHLFFTFPANAALTLPDSLTRSVIKAVRLLLIFSYSEKAADKDTEAAFPLQSVKMMWDDLNYSGVC